MPDADPASAGSTESRTAVAKAGNAIPRPSPYTNVGGIRIQTGERLCCQVQRGDDEHMSEEHQHHGDKGRVAAQSGHQT